MIDKDDLSSDMIDAVESVREITSKYRLVPVDPTPNMLLAAQAASDLSLEQLTKVYKIMVVHADEEVTLLKS